MYNYNIGEIINALSIEFVAIYLRKSRDDKSEEDVLANHRLELVELAQKYNLKYVIYEEIGTSDSIEFRPELKKTVTRS